MLALSFLAPSRLWLLLLPTLLLAAYVVSQLRRRGYVVRFTTMDLLDSVAPKRPRWRRHLHAGRRRAGARACPGCRRSHCRPERSQRTRPRGRRSGAGTG